MKLHLKILLSSFIFLLVFSTIAFAQQNDTTVLRSEAIQITQNFVKSSPFNWSNAQVNLEPNYMI